MSKCLDCLHFIKNLHYGKEWGICEVDGKIYSCYYNCVYGKEDRNDVIRLDSDGIERMVLAAEVSNGGVKSNL